MSKLDESNSTKQGGFLQSLREANKKTDLFNDDSISVSYPLGFPCLDQRLGAVYVKKAPDGSVIRDVQLGVPAGTFTIFCGQTSSGKTTAAIQAAVNIVEPFGEYGVIIHRDGEKSTTIERVQQISGWTTEQLKASYSLEKDSNTWESVLQEIIATANEKEAKGSVMRYKTGHFDINGNETEHWIPTVFIIDSLSKFMSEKEALDAIGGITGGPRGAIYNGVFFRNALEYMWKYNINVFVINHLDDAIPDMRGMQKPKQMTFMPSGKYMSGGQKTKLFTSSIIYFNPHTRKDDIKTEDENGWNGVPTDAYVIKSRSSLGGFTVLLEFIQESGFNSILTLMSFAKEKGLILGRNPGCYFDGNPDVKFDTRIFMKEVNERPEIIKSLFDACRKPLEELIPVIDLTEANEVDEKISTKRGSANVRNMLRDMYAHE